MRILKSVRQRTQDLREWCDESLGKASQRQSEDAQQHQAHLTFQAQQLVRDMYIDLWKRIFCGVGVGNVVEFFSPQIVYLDDYGPQDMATVQRLVKELCGIDVWLSRDQERHRYVTADLNTATARICYVYRRDMARKLKSTPAKSATTTGSEVKPAISTKVCRVVRTEHDVSEDSSPHINVIHKLDFPALIQENRRKVILWQEHLDEIAKQLIDKCHVRLEALPRKFYGLDTKQELIDYHGQSLLFGKFKFETLQMCYHDLSNDWRRELLVRANSMIRGGEISIERDASNAAQLYIRRCVPSYGTAEPYFDYGKFCAQYDKPSAELCCVFAQLTNNFVLTPDHEQILVLQPERKLHYIFSSYRDEVDYSMLNRSLKRDPPVCGVSVMDGLLQAVRTAFPGIRVDGADSVEMGFENICISGQYNREESYLTLSIRFEMAEPVECCDFLKRQHAIERKIKHIRTHKLRYLATKVAEIVLDYIEELRETQMSPHAIQKRWFYFAIDARPLRIALNGDLQSYIVDLTKVKDSAFQGKINAAILEKTDGLISADVRNGSFMLTP